MSTRLEIRRENAVAHLILRGDNHLHLLSRATLAEMRSAVARLAEDPAIGALIVSGSGGKAFS
ncbi:MAG: crotonase, partial [Cyanobacteria bacterium REEB65]|nr:crotonase [Cyanobacteria bacterium REEB65]